MKADFSSLNNRVNSHVDAIKQLEGQLSQLSAQSGPKVIEKGEVVYTTTLRANDDKNLVVVTQSGKVVVCNMKGNDGIQAHEEENPIQAPENHKQSLAEELQKGKGKSTSTPKLVKPLPKINPSFPQRFKKINEDEKFKKYLSVFKKLSINLPLMEALFEMLSYAKFMKELVTKKTSMDFETTKTSHNCSAIMNSEMIKKKEYPGSFTIPCTICMLQFAKAICDLGEV
ncbi:uncharacterized protein LOC125822239 [Solanum verrucosum]|uniref:uncharacterized protein LOC125822239 n=1 Tax=Solanum verrucosum TaxID=315347 RepID=UPI0020D0E6E6|nr:uncharacterized protein LOC125822239 [Solanum verrucosum]